MAVQNEILELLPDRGRCERRRTQELKNKLLQETQWIDAMKRQCLASVGER
jgi:hypothetical protein